MAEEESQAIEEESIEEVTEQQSDEQGQAEVSVKQTDIIDTDGQETNQQNEPEQAEQLQEVSNQVDTSSKVELDNISTEQTAVSKDEDENAIDLLKDVELNVKIELGRTKMYVEDVLRIAEGSVVELDKIAGDPVDIYVNERLVARGEVLVLNENFCVRVNQIVRDVV